jgi:integrase
MEQDFYRGRLEAARKLNPHTATVFPSPLGDGPMIENAVARALHRNLNAFTDAACALQGNDNVIVPAFTPHDLRRTASSQMASIGVPRLTVSKILNHVERGATAVYDRHSYDREKRAALELWGAKLVDLGLEATIAGLPRR